MSKNKTSKLGVRFATATIDPTTINEEERSVEVTFATETPVEQWVLGEYGFEVLRCEKKNVDLKRFESGVVPLLDAHNRWSIKSQIGSATDPQISDKVARCTIRLSKREDVESIWQDIKDGIIKGISVGYRVTKYIIDRTLGEVPYFYAEKWETREISLAPVPADHMSGVRSSSDEEQELNECQIIEKSRTEMTEKEKQAAELKEAKIRAAGGTHNPEITVSEEVQRKANEDFEAEQKRKSTNTQTQTQTPEEAQRAANEAVANERKRVSEINSAVRTAGLDNEFAAEYIEKGSSVDEVRAAIITEIGKNQENIRGSQSGQVRVGQEHIEKVRKGMEEALSHRAAPGGDLKEEARPYRGMNLVRMSEEILRVSNIDVSGMTQRQIAERALSTSDFPIILGNTVNRSLRRAYELAPRTFMPFARRGSAKDFREMTKAQISGIVDTFDEIPEGGEYKRSKMDEAGEKYKVVKYGKIIPITWETLINDDLDAFSRIPTALANKAAQKQSDLVWGIITGNPAMADGNALFSAAHGNLAGAGTAIDVAALSAARKAMRNQKSLSDDYINVTPAYIMVGPDKETEAQQIIQATIVATKDADTNPFKNWVQQIVEPRLQGNAWYLSADPGSIDTIEYAFLDGEEEIFLEQRQGFDVDGVEIKARMVFGAKAIDWRGFYKNPGN